ncbi:hypothetical protein [Deinococcus fonticola]|uniref:hypothetical protein n=1 Tax=Deinococcus fonticola TaxID=2528713 RepID=UPI001074DF89|nr:hypothetical protein [Deinococcus fonticola]
MREWKEKQAHCEVQAGRETTSVRPIHIVADDGKVTELKARTRDYSNTDYSYGMLGTRRVSTGSKAITETSSEIVGTPPVLDPPLDLSVYASRTTVTSRKTWTEGGWARMLSVTTVQDTLKDGAVIYSRTTTDITTWKRNRRGGWSTVLEHNEPVEVPVYGDDGGVSYYVTIPHTSRKETPDAGPPEMAPQSDDGLRNLAGTSGGEASFTTTPEVMIFTTMSGPAETITFDWLRGIQAVTQASGLVQQLRGGPRRTQQRTYFVPTALDRGGAITGVTVTANAEDLEAPYKEEHTLTWTE